jgi:hypothetical protein
MTAINRLGSLVVIKEHQSVINGVEFKKNYLNIIIEAYIHFGVVDMDYDLFKFHEAINDYK